MRGRRPVEPYVADFACVEAMLVVEVDGLSHDVPDQVAHDLRRTVFLEAAGWRVLRVRDGDAFSDPKRVLEQIKQALAQ